MALNDEQKQEAKLLYEEGHTLLQIGNIFTNRGFPMTRSAIGGALKRLGVLGARLPNHLKSYNAETKARKEAEKKAAERPKIKFRKLSVVKPESGKRTVVLALPQKPPYKLEDTSSVMPEGITLMQLTSSSCRWPGDSPTGVGHVFCGKRAVEGMPYCAAHCEAAYRPIPSRGRPYVRKYDGPTYRG